MVREAWHTIRAFVRTHVNICPCQKDTQMSAHDDTIVHTKPNGLYTANHLEISRIHDASSSRAKFVRGTNEVRVNVSLDLKTSK